jgi:hypothetical protein
VEGKELSREEDLEFEKQLQLLNKQASSKTPFANVNTAGEVHPQPHQISFD